MPDGDRSSRKGRFKLQHTAPNGRQGTRRVLVISQQPLLPKPWLGSQIRLARITQALAEHFHVDVVWATAHDEEPGSTDLARELGVDRIVQLQQPAPEITNIWWGSPVDMIRALLPSPIFMTLREHRPPAVSKWLSTRLSEYDAIWASRSWTGEAARAAGHPRVVVDVDDFESGLVHQQLEGLGSYKRRPIHDLMLRRMRRYENSLTDRFARVVISHPDDLDRFSTRSSARVSLVRNGVDLPDIPPAMPAAGRQMLFVGALAYHPNVDAVLYFAEQVLPIIRRTMPGAHFCVAGRGPVSPAIAEASKRLAFDVNESPADVHALYRACTCVVAPLLGGQGTSLKTLEALAQLKPLVATSVALRGLPVENGVHVLQADSAVHFADHCVAVLKDPARFEAMTCRGRALVESQYGWNQVTTEAVRAIQQVLTSRLS